MSLTYSEKMARLRAKKQVERDRNRAAGLCPCGYKRDSPELIQCRRCRNEAQRHKNRLIFPGGLTPKRKEKLGTIEQSRGEA